jgi:hypothetical protein
MSNVPDDWDSFWNTCSRCHKRYHASEGGCACEDHCLECGAELESGKCPNCDKEEPVAITVGKLIEKMKEFDPKTEIVMSRDPEGTEFSPMGEEFSHSYWYNDEIFSEEEATDCDVDKKMTQKVLVFWPIW